MKTGSQNIEDMDTAQALMTIQDSQLAKAWEESEKSGKSKCYRIRREACRKQELKSISMMEADTVTGYNWAASVADWRAAGDYWHQCYLNELQISTFK